LADLGYQALLITLALTFYAAVIYILEARKSASLYLESAHRAVYASLALVTLASAALVYAFLTRDFQIQYVAHYSNRSLSWFYTLAAFWAGQDGSLLFWTWLLTIFAAVVLVTNKKRNPELLPITMAVIQVTTLFFLYLATFKTNPFARTPFVPEDGNGLNPLLQNPGMVFHPPSLYIGFVAFTVPFAFAIAALVNKSLDERWIKSIRRWTLFAWLFLTIGNILGMQWAYVELGWGGYWAWDPVENASFLPWLTGTAFLHSVIVQERKGMLKIWNMVLVTLTFALTIFGTFVTRSGVIASVHAFGVSNLGPAFLIFLGLILVGSAGLIINRRRLLEGRGQVGSWTSKESSFLLNNILFVALTLAVLLGTIWPTVTEAINHQKITVGADWFNRMATPIGLAIFALTGLCALFAWNKTSRGHLQKNLLWPGITTAGLIILLVILGVRGNLPLFALAIAIFSLSATLLEFLRGARVRSRTDQIGFGRALISLAQKNKRRYGGYIVHLGVLMLFLGIIGSSAFSIDREATLQKGESLEIGHYRLLYQGIRSEQRPDRRVDAARFDLFINGKPAGTLEAEKHLHPNFQPATEVAIRSNLREDLYVILASYDLHSQAATVSVMINPLMIWMWIGGIVMTLGTLLAISPQRWGQKKE
jgi:cytochrome c-type biogenesis protein CcmF